MTGGYGILLVLCLLVLGGSIGVHIAERKYWDEGAGVFLGAVFGFLLGSIIILMISPPPIVKQTVKVEKIEKKIIQLVSGKKIKGDKKYHGGYVSFGIWGRGGYTEGRTPDKIEYWGIDEEGTMRPDSIAITDKETGETKNGFGFQKLLPGEQPYLTQNWTEKSTIIPGYKGDKWRFGQSRSTITEIIVEKEFIFHLPEEALPKGFSQF